MPGILPPLSLAESLEVTAIHSVAGQLPAGSPLVTHAPFQAPHHGSTAAAIVGGGSGIARPGAASLAHRGVLFLDEARDVKYTHAGTPPTSEDDPLPRLPGASRLRR
jgi:magnesium chelatase family protein